MNCISEAAAADLPWENANGVELRSIKRQIVVRAADYGGLTVKRPFIWSILPASGTFPITVVRDSCVSVYP